METALPWEAAVQEELVRLVELHTFDFDLASQLLRKAIKIESIPTRSSTRNRVEEFTAEVCRIRFSEIDQLLEEPVQDNIRGEPLESQATVENQDAVPETTELAELTEAEKGMVEETKDLSEESSSSNVQLSLGIEAELAFLELDLFGFQGLPGNQEDDEISELGQVLRMLESKSPLAKGKKNTEDVFARFSAEVAKLESDPPAVPAKLVLAQISEREEKSQRKSVKTVEKNKKSRPNRAAFLYSKGTRDEVYSSTNDNEEDYVEEEEKEWRASRRAMKMQVQ